METFGQWLQEELRKRGMRQADLAKESGLTPTTISRLINETRLVPDDVTCIKIAAALGNVSVEEVFRRAGKLPPEPPDRDPTLGELYEIGKKLTYQQRLELLEFAYFQWRRGKDRERADKSSGEKPDEPETSPRRPRKADEGP